MNGIYGLRPSFNRMPYYGAVNSMQGQDSLPSVMGPLSISLTGIKAFVRAILSRKPWMKDPLAVRKPWDEKEYELAEHGYGKKLCFGILWNDGAVVPHPPIIRGLEMTKQALIAAGHEGKVVPSFVPTVYSSACYSCRLEAIQTHRIIRSHGQCPDDL